MMSRHVPLQLPPSLVPRLYAALYIQVALLASATPSVAYARSLTWA